MQLQNLQTKTRGAFVLFFAYNRLTRKGELVTETTLLGDEALKHVLTVSGHGHAQLVMPELRDAAVQFLRGSGNYARYVHMISLVHTWVL